MHDYRKNIVCLLFLIGLTSCAGFYNNRGIDYDNRGEFDQAIVEYNKAIELNPKLDYAYNNRGLAYKHKGEFDQAISDYTKAIELNPKLDFAYSNRGSAYKAKGQFDKAITDHSKAIELYNSHKDTHEFDKIKVFKDNREAIEYKSKRNAAFYYNRGSAYIAKGQFDQAIDDYNRAIEFVPNYSDVYMVRGNVYQLRGQIDRAIADYSKAVDLNPNNEYAYLHLLIVTWLSKGNDIDTVNKLRQHLVSMKSDKWVHIILRYYLGVDGLNEQSILSEAIKGKNSQENRERLCEAYYYLGAKLLADGNRNDAANYFSKSIENGVNTDTDEYDLSKTMLTQMQEGKI